MRCFWWIAKSALGQAVAYTLNMWPKLRRCFDYAEVELSNNLAENSMRPVALGRKNWLHVGSAQSGPKVAAILSIVESCRRLGVPVKDYLLDILPGMARRNLSEVARLTPARWAASRNVSFRQGCVRPSDSRFLLCQEAADGGSADLKLAGDFGFADSLAM